MNREKLEEAIDMAEDMLKKFEPNSEEYGVLTTNLDKLIKMKLDLEKADRESADLKSQQKDRGKDRLMRFFIGVAEVAVPSGIYWWWLNRGFEFEKEGAITSFTFRNLIGKLGPKKK